MKMTSTSKAAAAVKSSSPPPPSHFICPITLEAMVHPMVSPDGLRYERYAILEWLWFGGGDNSSTTTCPLTRKPLHPDQLQHDDQLQNEIDEWRRRQKRQRGGGKAKRRSAGELEGPAPTDDQDKKKRTDDNNVVDVMPLRLINLRSRILLQLHETRYRTLCEAEEQQANGQRLVSEEAKRIS